MRTQNRWEYCIYQRGDDVHSFINDYFTASDKRVLFVGGLGFDQRTLMISTLVAPSLSERMHGFIIKEERPNPEQQLVERSEFYLNQMRNMFSKLDTQVINIFAPDGAVVGGRSVVLALRQLSFDKITDILVDASTLSFGLLFPLIRYILGRIEVSHRDLHLHVMAANFPIYDSFITSTASDAVCSIHGFKGGLDLDQNFNAARLWLPQLTYGQRSVLERLHTYINPHDVCPILPFPAYHPRLADKLIEHYQQEFESTWAVDDNAIVYASEHNPINLYRTILKIDSARKSIFSSSGNSLSILSPMGSKILALGSMMAAIERDLPVVYVETIAYKADWPELDKQFSGQGEILHLWLHNGQRQNI